MPFFIANIFLGFSGFLLSLYIAHKKRRKTEHFVCPLRGNCTEVVHSPFSRFLGIPVEYLGLFYYAIIAIGYGFRATWPDLNGYLVIPLVFLSTFALLFSFYLTFIQVFTLRKLCTWCLISATFTLFIFFDSLFGSFTSIIPFLDRAELPISILHVFGIAMGLGAATLADIFFFKFLKDAHISEFEADVLQTFSQIIWLAIGIILMTGLGLYLPEMGSFNQQAAFLMKWGVLFIIVINAALLNLFVTPKFLQIQFGIHEHEVGELIQTRRLVFLFGPISLVSWYAVFVLEAVGNRAIFSFETLFQIYASLVIFSTLVGQVFERQLSVKKTRIG